jgi:hypothetical protein
LAQQQLPPSQESAGAIAAVKSVATDSEAREILGLFLFASVALFFAAFYY